MPHHVYVRDAILFQRHKTGSFAKDGLPCLYVVVLEVVDTESSAVLTCGSTFMALKQFAKKTQLSIRS